MSDMYAIKGSTLTAIGDAIREKQVGSGDLYINEDVIFEMTDEIYLGANLSKIITFELAPNIKQMKVIIDIDNYQGQSSFTTGQVVYKVGNVGTRIECYSLGTKISFSESLPLTLTFENQNKINFICSMDYGYGATIIPMPHIELIGLDENENEYRYTPLGMADKINEFEVPHIEPIVLSGSVSYYLTGSVAGAYINNFGNKMSTENLSYISTLCQYNTAIRIPFDLNCDGKTVNSFSYLFGYCKKLEQLPRIINGKPNALSDMFNGCFNLREIEDDFCDTWDWSALETITSSYGGSRQSLFKNCYSLRKYPNELLNHYAPKSSYSMAYAYMFQSCYCLDAINDLCVSVGEAPITSNLFANAFDNTHRLKSLTFALNNGNPVVVDWSKQTIDLSGSVYAGVGYSSTTTGNFTNYNSGISGDTEVKDDATYQMLKDNPDWFATKIEYSRYNHDSAVETINSLPDCSATGTNIIQFRGQAGSLTDGGAINTLTEEEIAVATAKGWTVSLV